MRTAGLASALSRVFCGAVFVLHGWPKVLNFSATMSMFEHWGFPGWAGVPIGLLELFGGLVLIAGLKTRVMASIFIVEMVVAGAWVHFPNGFFVFNGGYEFAAAMIVLLTGVLILGPGGASLDTILSRREPTSKVPPPTGPEPGFEDGPGPKTAEPDADTTGPGEA